MRKGKQNLAGKDEQRCLAELRVSYPESTALAPCQYFGWLLYTISDERSRRAAFMKYPQSESLNKSEEDTGKNVYPSLLSCFNGLPFFSAQLSPND